MARPEVDDSTRTARPRAAGAEDVGRLHVLFAQAVLLLVVRRGAHFQAAAPTATLAQVRGDRLVHAVGIDLGDGRVLLLVAGFVPDGDADGHSGTPEIDDWGT